MKWLTLILFAISLTLGGVLAWDRFDPIPDVGNPGVIETKTNTIVKTRTVTQTVTKPNGEVTQTTTTTTDTRVKTEVKPPRNYRLDGAARLPYNDLKSPPTWELTVNRRVFENVWIGAGTTIEKVPAVSLKLGLEF